MKNDVDYDMYKQFDTFTSHLVKHEICQMSTKKLFCFAFQTHVASQLKAAEQEKNDTSLIVRKRKRKISFQDTTEIYKNKKKR
jgi:hypothetical protein